MRIKKNVFIIDCDEAVLERLKSLQGAEDCEFFGLFHAKSLAERGTPPVGDLLHQAENRLNFFNGSVDAVLGFRGFPIDMITATLARNLDLPGLSPSGVLKCEHRYWERLELKRAFELFPEEATCPRFARVDWGSIEFAPLPPFDPPLLLKPVLQTVAPGSGDPFEIRVLRGEDFSRSLRRFGRVPRTNGDLDYFLEQIDVPQELLDMRGEGVFAEEWIRGTHHRVDAYSREGEVSIYGVIDTHWEPEGDGVRFEYPSGLGPGEQAKLERAVRRIADTFGLDGGPFSVDFVFPATSKLNRPQVPVVAGVSCGISAAFAGLYERVDGMSCFQVAFDLALRRRPGMVSRKGRHPHAARFLLHGPSGLRKIELPPPERIAEIERAERATIRFFLDSGFTVADRYIFGAVEIGSESKEPLVGRYRAIRDALGIKLSDTDGGAAQAA